MTTTSAPTRCTNRHQLFSTKLAERVPTPLPSFKWDGYFDNRQMRIRHIELIWTPSPCKNSSETKAMPPKLAFALAELDCDSGKGANAEQLSRTAVEAFRTDAYADEEIFAQSMLSRSLLQQGKVDEARAAIGEAVRLSGKSRDVTVRIPMMLDHAQVMAAWKELFPASPISRSARSGSYAPLHGAASQHYGWDGEDWLAEASSSVLRARSSRPRSRVSFSSVSSCDRPRAGLALSSTSPRTSRALHSIW
jgi:hypothetical protein